MKNIFFIFGTRPEAIKLAPLIKEFQKHPDLFKVRICVTAQHREMLDQVLAFFKIKPDFDLSLMKKNQTLAKLTVDIISDLTPILEKEKPDIVFVQGDTTTVFAGALAAFYQKIKIAHVEAGLRSGEKYSPFPEEINRTLTGHMADWHFAPTKKAVANLNSENIIKNIYNVGNTVIDALSLGLKIIEENGEQEYVKYFNSIDFSKKIILVTSHRRESFGKPFENICYALKEISEYMEDVEIVFPVHLNPNIRKVVNKILSGIKNIHLLEPLGYPYLLWLMNKSYLVLTDSGGIQEEAPALGKPVLVMRDVTERTEGIDAGTAKLVGTNRDLIVREVVNLLGDRNAYKKMANAINPYGDGTTSIRIVNILKEGLNV